MKTLLSTLCLVFLTTFISFSQDTLSVIGCLGDSIQIKSKLKYYSSYSWTCDNNYISMDEFPIMQFNQSGIYFCTATAYDACCPNDDTTQIVSITIENSFNCNLNYPDSIVSVSPNPGYDFFNVSYYIYPGNINVSYQIKVIELSTGLLKKTVNLSHTSESIELDLSDQNSGLYNVSLIANGIIVNQKLISIN